MRSAALFEADKERRSGRGGKRPEARRVPRARATDAPARFEESLTEEDPRTPATDDGKKSGKKSWFLHDDRDREELEVGPAQRRTTGQNEEQRGRNRRSDQRTGGVSREAGLSDAPAEGRPSRWEYVDPKGNIQGPFPASDLLKWVNGGFFSADQKVRRAGQQAFAPLKSVLPQLNREAEGKAPPAPRPVRRPNVAEMNGRAVHEDVPVRRAVAQLDGRAREQRQDRSRGGAGYQGQHPADALLSTEETAARAHNAAVEGDGYAPRDARGGRGGRHGFEPAGRGGGRRDNGGAQGFRERGRAGGRGDGYGRGGRGAGGPQARAIAVTDTAEARLPFSYKIAQKLFTAEAELATDEPMWRYIDPSGTVQGPFPARNMLEWYRKGMLHDMGLQVCGAERKVAPPDMPLPIHYHKLGDLLESVKRGQHFVAVSVADIRSGTARPLLLAKADASASSGARKTDAPKAGKRKEARSAARPAKAAGETVTVKLAFLESSDGVTVELTVLPAAQKPEEAPAAKEPTVGDATGAEAPAADQSSGAAPPAASDAAKPTAPLAAALPDTLLPDIKDSAVETVADAPTEADGAAGTAVDAEAAGEESAAGAEPATDAASKSAPDVPAPTAAAAVDKADAAADSTEENATESKEGTASKAAGEESLPAEAADEPAPAVAALEAVSAESAAAGESKEAVSAAAAEPAEGADKSASAEDAKVQEVQAVLASNVSAVMAAESETAADSEAVASIAEDAPAAAQQPAKGASLAEESDHTHGGSITAAPDAQTPAHETAVAGDKPSAHVEKEHSSGGAAAEDKTEAAEAHKAKAVDALPAAEAPPAVETPAVKEAASPAEDASDSVEEETIGKEGSAKEDAEDAKAEKPKEQTSMFKSALKMFQGK